MLQHPSSPQLPIACAAHEVQQAAVHAAAVGGRVVPDCYEDWTFREAEIRFGEHAESRNLCAADRDLIDGYHSPVFDLTRF
ncbi:MAG: hypothetical protein RB191_09885 [Terriglobia bacterium]|nr:hypothetical protein [Terriglobia bacterium]